MMPGGGSRVPVPSYVPEILPEHLPEGHLSLAVFGPGEGEAIVVRLPDGAVGVVDGCREPERGNSVGRGDPVRELLDRLATASGHPESFRIAFVCLTHPHADHYGGLGRLINAYEGRIDGVWTVTHILPQYASALPEWLALTRAGKVSLPDDQDFAGLQRVIDAFHNAKSGASNGLSLLSNGKSLLSKPILGHRFAIDACGPADDDIDQAGKDVVYALKGEADGARGKHDPNLTSGALLVRWGASAVLLAGDLLRGAGPNSGWQRARRHVKGRVQVVNVAHHASEEAHDDELWTSMEPDLAIVTPFKHAMGRQPPRPEQIDALASAAVVAITSPPVWPGGRGQPRAMRAARPRASGGKIAGKPIVPSGTGIATRNAVAVSLDAAGNITRFVLAGAADVYDAPPATP